MEDQKIVFCNSISLIIISVKRWKKQKLFMEIKEFWTKPMNFLCDKYWYPHFRKEKENYEEVKNKNKKTFYYILLLSCWHLLGEISLGEKEILQKPRSNQKWKNKSEAYLKEIPRLFIHYCGKMKVLLWKKTSSNSYLM